MSFAPIVLFVYNRPLHTKRTVEALQNNVLAKQSNLIIYSDAPKNDHVFSQVQEVRDYLKTVDDFKSVKIIERDSNWGLAANIIDGVTDVVNQYGKVIVMEDDIVTSPAFLSFMNQALDFYEKEKNVWHISGWNYPIDLEVLGDVFFWRVMNCWGWATWADRWSKFEKNPGKMIAEWTEEEKKHFDLDNSGVFWNQIKANSKGIINTWAIFWYSTIYEKKGLCLNPTQTYVDNIGHDGSGVHCGNSKASNQPKPVLCTKKQIDWPRGVEESTFAVKSIKTFYKKQKKPLFIRALNKLARLTVKKICK